MCLHKPLAALVNDASCCRGVSPSQNLRRLPFQKLVYGEEVLNLVQDVRLDLVEDGRFLSNSYLFVLPRGISITAVTTSGLASPMSRDR